ncbi:hypothetical protein BH09MYX1_BH09MYX1_50960 [soil metagenome]
MLPERRFEIVSALAPTEVHDRLAQHVGPKPPPGSTLTLDRPYFGALGLASFELTPFASRNRFLPRAEGRVVPNGAGSLVSIRMRMLPFTLLVVVAWIALGALSFVAALVAVIRDGVARGFAWVHALPLVLVAVFPIASLVVPRLRFRREAQPLEEFLRRTLDPAP